MRWFWVDRFDEFVSRQYAVSLKNVTLSDEPMDEYSPGRPYFPASLIVEALAQTGGLLIAQVSDFEKRVVLAKVSKSQFHFQACPGDTMRMRTDIDSLQAPRSGRDGNRTRGRPPALRDGAHVRLFGRAFQRDSTVRARNVLPHVALPEDFRGGPRW